MTATVLLIGLNGGGGGGGGGGPGAEREREREKEENFSQVVATNGPHCLPCLSTSLQVVETCMQARQNPSFSTFFIVHPHVAGSGAVLYVYKV